MNVNIGRYSQSLKGRKWRIRRRKRRNIMHRRIYLAKVLFDTKYYE